MPHRGRTLGRPLLIPPTHPAGMRRSRTRHRIRSAAPALSSPARSWRADTASAGCIAFGERDTFAPVLRSRGHLGNRGPPTFLRRNACANRLVGIWAWTDVAVKTTGATVVRLPGSGTLRVQRRPPGSRSTAAYATAWPRGGISSAKQAIQKWRRTSRGDIAKLHVEPVRPIPRAIIPTWPNRVALDRPEAAKLSSRLEKGVCNASPLCLAPSTWPSTFRRGTASSAGELEPGALATISAGGEVLFDR